jgi:hypothetical protein
MGLRAEAAEHDAGERWRFPKMIEHGGDGNACRAGSREAIGSSGDGREGDRCQPMVEGKIETVRVAQREQAILVVCASAPDRTNGVDHIAGGQAEARCDLRLPGLAPAKPGAGRAELRPRGAMDGAIDPATAKQGFVGGIHDGINVEGGDVAFDNGDAVPHGPIETPRALQSSPADSCGDHLAEAANHGESGQLKVSLGGVGGDALEMRLVQVALDIGPLLRRLGQEVDVHLVGAEPCSLMAEMGKVQRNRIVLGLA